MHHGNIVMAVTVRMSVFFGRLSVRCPARMADARKSGKIIINKFFLKFRHFPGGPLNGQSAAVRRHESHACRIIAAIFQAPQSLQKDRQGVFISDVSNNSAHKE